MIDMHVFNESQLRKIAYAWLNIDKDMLEKAGVMKRGQVGGSDWKRFNDNPMTFIVKLPTDKLSELCKLINEQA